MLGRLSRLNASILGTSPIPSLGDQFTAHPKIPSGRKRITSPLRNRSATHTAGGGFSSWQRGRHRSYDRDVQDDSSSTPWSSAFVHRQPDPLDGSSPVSGSPDGSFSLHRWIQPPGRKMVIQPTSLSPLPHNRMHEANLALISDMYTTVEKLEGTDGDVAFTLENLRDGIGRRSMEGRVASGRASVEGVFRLGRMSLEGSNKRPAAGHTHLPTRLATVEDPLNERVSFSSGPRKHSGHVGFSVAEKMERHAQNSSEGGAVHGLSVPAQWSPDPHQTHHQLPHLNIPGLSGGGDSLANYSNAIHPPDPVAAYNIYTSNGQNPLWRDFTPGALFAHASSNTIGVGRSPAPSPVYMAPNPHFPHSGSAAMPPSGLGAVRTEVTVGLLAEELLTQEQMQHRSSSRVSTCSPMIERIFHLPGLSVAACPSSPSSDMNSTQSSIARLRSYSPFAAGSVINLSLPAIKKVSGQFYHNSQQTYGGAFPVLMSAALINRFCILGGSKADARACSGVAGAVVDQYLEPTSWSPLPSRYDAY